MNSADLPGRVDETIESIAELERKTLNDASLHQRRIERAIDAVGRPSVVYGAAGVMLAWVALNLSLVLVRKTPLDAPPFFALQTVATIGSLLVSLMVLTAANRGNRLDEQRDRLHLQITLLTDRKTAKIIELLEELRRDLPNVPNRRDREASELTLPTDPHAVSAELERRTPSRIDDPGVP